ncbi:uncharacterized protein LOC121682035 isoform X1 [Alosa sapidissima]|uniref:uncharacterized protein LOC121682035 isoform X1 n=2 Tax=Alosa sapidissima TaxID=34773 RepID=UPI001C08A1E5|nr:uncharacterized protein LOC121682035 isoform X1 [Alosa sapidissima]XP_041917969.1 uncharacterized protein LOC121682035 isoform X1 [Alosa sapidissima]
MKDCSEHVNVYYGDKLEIFPPRRAAMLEFSPSRRPSGQRVVWRRGRTGQINNWWSVNTTTPDHEGNYTACTHSGVELRKTRVSVIARTLQAIVEEEESLVFPLPIPASTALISFRDPSGMEHVLYQNGRERLDAFDLFKGRFSLQNQPSGSRVQIHDLRPGDAGTYEVRDLNGFLVISAVLESTAITEGPPSFKSLYVTLGVILSSCLVLCCCVCKCCCRRSHSSKAPSTLNHSPGPYNASDAGNWYCPPVPRSALIDDFEHIPTAPDTQVQATSQCPFTSNLSPQSDAGPCFQPKRRLGDSLDFLSTNPLSTDMLLATTYTSEKLNFL